jgi:nicotinamide-nucleotide amidase
VTARARTKAEAERLIDPVHAEIEAILGKHLYGTDQTNLEESLVHELRRQGKTVAVAESVTGGQLAARITSVPGASQVFNGGVVAYTIPAKESLIGVTLGLLSEYGPVSKEAAVAMAEGARTRLGADVAIAITGNAGPTADVGDQPVGLILIALADADGTRVQEHRFRGTREDIQRRATQTALTDLRTSLSA